MAEDGRLNITYRGLGAQLWLLHDSDCGVNWPGHAGMLAGRRKPADKKRV